MLKHIYFFIIFIYISYKTLKFVRHECFSSKKKLFTFFFVVVVKLCSTLIFYYVYENFALDKPLLKTQKLYVSFIIYYEN